MGKLECSCVEPLRFASLGWMPLPASEQVSRTIEDLYRTESGRVLATLVRGERDIADIVPTLTESSRAQELFDGMKNWAA